MVDRDLHGQRHKILTRTDITDDASERNEERETKERKEKRKEDALDTLEQLLEIEERINELNEQINAMDSILDKLRRGEKLDVRDKDTYSDLIRAGYIDSSMSMDEAQAKADQLTEDKVESDREDRIREREKLEVQRENTLEEAENDGYDIQELRKAMDIDEQTNAKKEEPSFRSTEHENPAPEFSSGGNNAPNF